MNDFEKKRKLEDILKDIEKNYEVLKEKLEFKKILEKEKGWLCNLEDKLSQLTNENDKNIIENIIKNIKNPTYNFTAGDITSLEIFISKINTIVNIADRVNNFKNSDDLDLPNLFNAIKKSNKLKDMKIVIPQQHLKPFLPHLYSIIKHCQFPKDYPIYYKFWKNIINKAFNKEKDYDSMCDVYKNFNSDSDMDVGMRHIQFGAYMGTIALMIIEEIRNEKLITSNNDTFYKYLENNLLNLEDYLEKTIVNNNDQTINLDAGEKRITTMPKSNAQYQPLNQILYGPPGTGKTYNTINKALEIIFGKELGENYFKLSNDEKEKRLIEQATKFYNSNKADIVLKKEGDERELLNKVFEYFKDEERGQIEFVTFHQSYGYEEFVEGIKAKTMTDSETNKKTITYDVEAGVFKQLCEQAKDIKSQKQSIYDFGANINIWKISLGDSQNSEEDYLFNYCIENNKILLGFGDGFDFSDCKNRQEIAKKLNNEEKYSYPPTAINTLKNKIKKDDIVLVSYGNRKLRAIAKVIEDYKYLDDENLKTYVQARGVEWLLIPEEPFLYEKVLKKQFSQMSIYDIKSNVKIDALRNLLTKNSTNTDYAKNYILIIDEINRGNISKIFGELITLIEPSKRIGADEALHVKLPYSNESFGVPSNLYIIGTMNTADRSIALMDTALRRRFDFTEMMPNLSVLSNDDKKVKNYDSVENQENDLMVGEINIRLLLRTINKRIEYLYDRDHTIGHAYFMSLNEKNDNDEAKVELDNIFKNKIIPLLQEYFYDDWEKIQIVLGDHYAQIKNQENYNGKDCESFDDVDNKNRFIQSRKITEKSVIGFNHENIEDEGKDYRINPNSDGFPAEAYLKLCQSK